MGPLWDALRRARDLLAAGEAVAEPDWFDQADELASGIDALLANAVCECGHIAHWHSHEGAGECDHDGDCHCQKFAAQEEWTAYHEFRKRTDPPPYGAGMDA